MSKYVDSEKLIAELTRMQFDLNAAYRHPQSDSIVRAISLEYDDILSLVDSLQQEQPEVDLEKEIKDWCNENITGVRPIYTADSLIYALLPKTARHFYELGLKAAREE